MKTVKIPIALPISLKKKLEVLREQGVTATGLIRHLLEQYFDQTPIRGKKGR